MTNIENRSVELFPSAVPGAPLVVVSTGMGEGGAVCLAVREATGRDFSLAAVGGLDWEEDLTPWPAPSLARGKGSRGGGADAYIAQLGGRILPELVSSLGAEPEWVGLAGYSLGGLLALYAPFRTDAFARVASASGSLWYPGFLDYALSHEPLRRPDSVYLSLGDREGRARNPLLRPVEENTRRLSRALLDLGIHTTLEMNPGGHFRDEVSRLARGISWILEA